MVTESCLKCGTLQQCCTPSDLDMQSLGGRGLRLPWKHACVSIRVQGWEGDRASQVHSLRWAECSALSANFGLMCAMP